MKTQQQIEQTINAIVNSLNAVITSDAVAYAEEAKALWNGDTQGTGQHSEAAG